MNAEKKAIMEQLTFGETDKEDRRILGAVADAAQQAKHGHFAVFTDFLDPKKAWRVADVFDDAKLFGGVMLAERVVAGFSPASLDADFSLADERFPIRRMKITPSYSGLAHKDYLGALTSIVSRGKIGDLIVKPDCAYVLVKTEAVEILRISLIAVGKTPSVCEEVDEVEFGAADPEQKAAFAPSDRLDGVLARCFGIPRTEAADYIKAGKVFVNWTESANVSASVREGDTFSIRGTGLGRAKIVALNAASKERIRIDYLKW